MVKLNKTGNEVSGLNSTNGTGFDSGNDVLRDRKGIAAK